MKRHLYCVILSASEESRVKGYEILRCAQDDKGVLFRMTRTLSPNILTHET